MRAGLGSSDQYIAQWHRESQPCEGDLEQVVEDTAAMLENAWTAERLDAVARRGGVAEKDEAHSGAVLETSNE